MKIHPLFLFFIVSIAVIVTSLSSQDILFEFPTEPGPVSLVIDTKGYVYIANSAPADEINSQKIQKYNRQGIFIKTFVDYRAPVQHRFTRYAPLDLTMDNDNQLYVLAKPFFNRSLNNWTEYNGFSVLKYDSAGTLLHEYCFPFKTKSRQPTSIFYHNNAIFLLNDVIMTLFLDTGTLKESFYHTRDGGDFALDNISDFIIDSADNFWSTGRMSEGDKFACYIMKMNADGLHLMQFQTPGRDSLVTHPGIAMNKAGDIFLVTDEIGEVQKFNQAGHILGRQKLHTDSTVRASLNAIAMSPNNLLYILDAKNQVVRVLNAFDKTGGSISGKFLSSRQQPGQAIIHYSSRGSLENNNTFTDGEGYYFIGGLKAGDYYLWAQNSDYLIKEESRLIQMPENGVFENINFEYLVPASVVGQIEGIANLPEIHETFLELINFEYKIRNGASLDNNGYFTFTNLWPGQGEIYVIPPASTGYAGTSLKISLQEGEQVLGLKLVLPRGAKISGHLKTDEDNLYPLRCLGISAIRVPEIYNTTSVTPSLIWPAPADDDGYYELCLVPGKYYLTPNQGFLCSMVVFFSSIPDPGCLVIQDVNQELKYDFSVNFKHFLVSGNVTDQTGQFLSQRATILAMSDSSIINFYWNSLQYYYTNLKQDGSYELPVHKSVDEDYTLYAITIDSTFSGMTVWGRIENLKGPVSDANFNLSHVGGIVRGKVLRPPVGSHVMVRILDSGKGLAGEVSRQFVNGDFNFVLEHVQPGEYEMIAFSSAHFQILHQYFSIENNESIEVPPLDFQVASVNIARQPVDFQLFTNFPNPFNACTQISFYLSAAGRIELTIFNLAGQPVRDLFAGKLASGSHLLTWDGTDNEGREVASGIYFYHLQVRGEDLRKTAKMVLIK